MKITMQQVIELFASINSITAGYEKIVREANGERAVRVHYDLDGETVSLPLAINVNKIRPHVEAYNKTRSDRMHKLLTEDFEGLSDEERRVKNVEAQVEFNREVNRMEHVEVEVDLSIIDKSELKLKSNPIPPGVLVGLLPVLKVE